MALIGQSSSQKPPALKIEPVKQVKKTQTIAAKSVAKQSIVATIPAPVATPVVAPAPPPVPTIPPGSHEDWMSQAGISQSDWPAVEYIVSHESGWNPIATEPTTGAHGLPQALPYTKTGCGWSDPICQLRWASVYAASRYGGWWPAQAYWAVHRNW